MYEFDLKRRKALFNRIYELLHEKASRERVVDIFRSLTEVVDRIDEINMNNDLRNHVLDEITEIIQFHKKEG